MSWLLYLKVNFDTDPTSSSTGIWYMKCSLAYSHVSGSEEQKAALRLLAVSRLINQAVGDALSGLLLVESILQYKGWSVHKWAGLYEDLPSRQLKVHFLNCF